MLRKRNKNTIIYNKITCLITKKGKKKLAFNIFLEVLKFLKFNLKTNAASIILKAIENCRATFGIKKTYRAGAVTYIPYVLNTNQSINQSLHWIIKSAKARVQNPTLVEKIAFEFYDASLHKGDAIKERKKIHYLAVENMSNLKYY